MSALDKIRKDLDATMAQAEEMTTRDDFDPKDPGYVALREEADRLGASYQEMASWQKRRATSNEVGAELHRAEGQVAKAANQVIVGLNIGAVAEAFALAKAAGVQPAKVREALQGGFADSRILEVHGKRMVDADYTPGARSTTQRKDMHQAVEFAASLGLDMPATTLSRTLYDQLIEQGGSDLDHAALFKLLDAS